MTISVRLDDKTKQALKVRARKAGVSMSELVRMAVVDKLNKNEQMPPRKTPYELWQEIFTGNDSGGVDDSERVKELVTKAINEKHARRDSK